MDTNDYVRGIAQWPTWEIDAPEDDTTTPPAPAERWKAVKLEGHTEDYLADVPEHITAAQVVWLKMHYGAIVGSDGTVTYHRTKEDFESAWNVHVERLWARYVGTVHKETVAS